MRDSVISFLGIQNYCRKIFITQELLFIMLNIYDEDYRAEKKGFKFHTIHGASGRITSSYFQVSLKFLRYRVRGFGSF